ncbi:hypothetical protein BYT27DRAFT_7199558 [Phlegmacium glaucopus]|nr:hypothetical protein BYT27DRAFT_7199558 [Phlegmacium glaucopus]
MYDKGIFYWLYFACNFIVPILDYLGCWIGVLSASLRPIFDLNVQALPRSRYPQLQALTPPWISSNIHMQRMK